MGSPTRSHALNCLPRNSSHGSICLVFFFARLPRILTCLIGTAETIDDVLCFSEVIETLDEADSIFLVKGLSPSFLDFLPSVKKVAGDIPNSKKFIEEFDKVNLLLNQVYDVKMKDAVNKIDVSKTAKSNAAAFTISIALGAIAMYSMLH